MVTLGQAVGAVGGAVIGGIAGGPKGAMWGLYIGHTLGSFLDPPKLKDPEKLKKYGLNTAETGIPIPVTYGVCCVPGNYIWKGGLSTTPIYQDVGATGGKKQKTGG